jgi:hypothetical protein
MSMAGEIFGVIVPTPGWSTDWLWGLPLIVLTVVIHVLGLGLIRQTAANAFQLRIHRHQHTLTFAGVLGATTLLATVLHGLEAGIWAIAYRFLGALTDFRSSMLYSLNAITSYGHTSLNLEDHWHLLGALEALNGWLVFGLTTAFLFAVIEQFGSPARKGDHIPLGE